jgi:c-di-GMP-binding flagellar brake protein YcgR
VEERRQYIRIKRSVVVSYRIVKQFLGSGSRTKDICAGGICLPVFQMLEPHTILDLEISLPDSINPIKATAEIVWVGKREDAQFPFEAGMKFLKIDLSGRDKIFNYVTRESQKEIKWIE